jgi:hypothetical protein
MWGTTDKDASQVELETHSYVRPSNEGTVEESRPSHEGPFSFPSGHTRPESLSGHAKYSRYVEKKRLAKKNKEKQREAEEEEEEEEGEEEEEEEEEGTEEDDEEEDDQEEDSDCDSLSDDDETFLDDHCSWLKAQLLEASSDLARIQNRNQNRKLNSRKRASVTSAASSCSSRTTAPELPRDQETVFENSGSTIKQKGIIRRTATAAAQMLGLAAADCPDPHENPTPCTSADAAAASSGAPTKASKPPAKKTAVKKAPQKGQGRKLRSQKDTLTQIQQQVPENIQLLQQELELLKRKYYSPISLTQEERERISFLLSIPPSVSAEPRTAADMIGEGRGGKGPKKTKKNRCYVPEGYQLRVLGGPPAEPMHGARGLLDSNERRSESRSRRGLERGAARGAAGEAAGEAAGGARLNDGYNPMGYPNPTQSGASYCYIKNIELQINGSAPDMFQGGGDKFHCVKDYVRLQELQGFDNKNITNALTHQLFNLNCYIPAWNLSCSPNSNVQNVQPTVPATNGLQVKIQFSSPLPCDLQMVNVIILRILIITTLFPLQVVWTQLSSALTIDHAKDVGVVYYNSYNAV